MVPLYVILIVLGIILLIIFWLIFGKSTAQSTSIPVGSGNSGSTPSQQNVMSSFCRTDSDCSSTTSSIACIQGRCIPSTCRTTRDCLANETCTSGICVPGTSENNRTPCSTTSDCSGASPYCVSNYCSSEPATVPANPLVDHDTCTTNADCSTGNCMDTGLGVKYCNVPQAECFFNYTGTSGLNICPVDKPYCVSGKCENTVVGSYCLTASDCGGLSCVNGKCTTTLGNYGDLCSINSDCSHPNVCRSGKCVPPHYVPRTNVNRPNSIMNTQTKPYIPLGTNINTQAIYSMQNDQYVSGTIPLAAQNFRTGLPGSLGSGLSGSNINVTQQYMPNNGRVPMNNQSLLNPPVNPVGSGSNKYPIYPDACPSLNERIPIGQNMLESPLDFSTMSALETQGNRSTLASHDLSADYFM